jgi:hypothetical protein
MSDFCTLFFIGAFLDVAYDVPIYIFIYVDMKSWFNTNLRGVRLYVF